MCMCFLFVLYSKFVELTIKLINSILANTVTYAHNGQICIVFFLTYTTNLAGCEDAFILFYNRQEMAKTTVCRRQSLIRFFLLSGWRVGGLETQRSTDWLFTPCSTIFTTHTLTLLSSFR